MKHYHGGRLSEQLPHANTVSSLTRDTKGKWLVSILVGHTLNRLPTLRDILPITLYCLNNRHYFLPFDPMICNANSKLMPTVGNLSQNRHINNRAGQGSTGESFQFGSSMDLCQWFRGTRNVCRTTCNMIYVFLTLLIMECSAIVVYIGLYVIVTSRERDAIVKIHFVERSYSLL